MPFIAREELLMEEMEMLKSLFGSKAVEEFNGRGLRKTAPGIYAEQIYYRSFGAKLESRK